MNLKFWKKREEKTDIVQYQGGVYYLGTSNISQLKLKNYLEAYKLNDAVYSCINLIARAASGIPWYVYRQRGKEIIEVTDNELVNWKDRPSPNMSWPKFMEKAVSYYLASGNCYTRKQVGSFGKYWETELLRPDKVTIKTNPLGITHYEYNLQGQVITIKPEEVLHIKMFNPLDDLYGLSPVDTIARMVDIATLNQAWTISFLENEAMIGGKVKHKGGLTKEQKEALKEQLKSDYGGVLNAGKWLVLEADMDAERFQSALKDLDTTPLEKLVLRKVCSIFKVPSELLGDSENKTYSNQKEARKSLYQETVLPILDLFRDEFNNWIVPDFDETKSLFLDYDTSDIEALSEDLDKLWDRAVKAIGGVPFLDRNEARDMLKYGSKPGLDIVTIPINQIPVEGSDKIKPGGKALTKSEDKKPSFWQRKENKEALWKHFVKRIEMKERAMIDPAEKFLQKQADMIRAKVAKLPSIAEFEADKLLDIDKEAKRFLNEFKGHYFEAFLSAGEAGYQAGEGKLLDLMVKAKEYKFTMNEELREEIRRMILNCGAQVSEKTLKKVAELGIKAAEEGWTVEELAQNIEAKLDELSIARARRISRTELAKIENWGQLEGYKQAEFVELKGWLSAFLPTTRPEHAQADYEYSNEPIPLNEPFIVAGEQLQYPGDPSGSPGNIIECKCTTYPEVKEI